MLDSCAYRIAVIGAGVAGGTCASRLLRLPGVHTTIYDMGSRGPGGRACSRPVDGKGGSFSPADRGGASSLSALGPPPGFASQSRARSCMGRRPA